MKLIKLNLPLLFIFIISSFATNFTVAQEETNKEKSEKYLKALQELGMKDAEVKYYGGGVNFKYNNKDYYLGFIKSNKKLYYISYNTKVYVDRNNEEKEEKQYEVMSEVGKKVRYVKLYAEENIIWIDCDFFCQSIDEFKNNLVFYLKQIEKAQLNFNDSLSKQTVK